MAAKARLPRTGRSKWKTRWRCCAPGSKSSRRARCPTAPRAGSVPKARNQNRGQSNTGKKPISELPSGSATLVADAHGFSPPANTIGRRKSTTPRSFTRTKRTFRRSPTSPRSKWPPTTSSRRKSNAQQAVSLAPEDAYSLGILGQIKFRQKSLKKLSMPSARLRNSNPTTLLFKTCSA